MIKKIILKMISLYEQLPIATHGYCKHVPTCSLYAKQAIEEHGLKNGIILSAKRILRCNPFGTYGYDPVPKELKRRKK